MPVPHKTAATLLAASACLLLSTTTLAAPPAGRLLTSQCAQCHGTDGNGPGFDNLAGKSYSELLNDLLEMKRRPSEGIMDQQARGYTDHQLSDIASYLSSLPGSGHD